MGELRLAELSPEGGCMNQPNEKPKYEPVMDFSRAAKQKRGLEKVAELREKLGLKRPE